MEQLVIKSSKGIPDSVWLNFFSALGIKKEIEKPLIITINGTEYASVAEVFGNDFTAFIATCFIDDYRYIIRYNDISFVSPLGILIISRLIKDNSIEECQPSNMPYEYKTYIVSDTKSGLYKIGKSKNPEYRVLSAFCNHPHIKLLFTCDKDVETILHVEYKKNKVSGEWFDLDYTDLDAIISKYGFKKTSR